MLAGEHAALVRLFELLSGPLNCIYFLDLNRLVVDDVVLADESMEQFSIKPKQMVASMLLNRRLISALAVREIAERYKGSFLGAAWTIIQPIFILAIYAFVFSEVLKARWPGGTGSKAEFALVLFSGLLVFNLFAEVFNRAPQLILSNASYVKRVVFPLEILSCVSVLSASFNLLVSAGVWFVFYFVAFGVPHLTALLLPLALLPFIFFVLGLSWMTAAFGVYLRDISQVTAIITTAVMFLTPIFFPLKAFPPQFLPLLNLNPLTKTINQVRDVLMWGKGIHWAEFGESLTISLVVMWLGFAVFQKTRRGFADVL